MSKDYLKNKTYDELKPKKENDKFSNFETIEPTNNEKLEVIELLCDGKNVSDIKKEWDREGLTLSKGQIKEIEADWKEALNEKKPKEDPLEEELKPKGK